METKQENQKLYAKCGFGDCKNKAEWTIGTWQCCDECAKKWVIETSPGYGYSKWGTSSRIGQAAILSQNKQFNLHFYLLPESEQSMATLIYASNSDGCIGKCDAKCYDAKEPHCDCICGGRNHGVGYNKAVDNTREYADEMMKQYEKDHPGAECQLNHMEVSQLKLF